ncbi:heparin lyase I family protein [Paenibacillus glycanilyticus]|uniref:Alginate lyase n=1 Tax=Paenibacillus glycanilyticus TaxID=126569 RepID=A0ABQ6G7S2_9BACL|nr:heparin lyase I family protein [Paenibacillus glycanilyticus]GLX66999.1 hypothetical protein MU1_13430 [Paenibacillus glycanilyticus]
MAIKRKWTLGMLGLVSSVTIFASVASASIIANIDVEGASINSTSWDLTDSGVTFEEKELDRNNMVMPYFSTWTPSGTGSSLKLQANPYTAGEKQRNEYYAARNQPFGEWRYNGFQIGIPSDSALPTNWVVLDQFHQDSYYVSPQGALELANVNGKLTYQFKVRNKDYYNIDGVNGPSGNALTLWSQEVTTDQFNSIVIGFKPDASGNGGVKIWYNGTQVVNWTGYLGFLAGFQGKNFINQYYNSFGMYRGAQNNTMKVYYDNYKWGTTYSDVAP